MTPYYSDPAITLYQGDALEVLRQLPADSVQCVITSPPYWSLRDYGIDGQLGLEESPQAYVAALVAVFDEVRRVLRSDGTVWLNLGDSYASNWPCNRRNVVGSGSLENGKREARPPRIAEGLKDKDLVGTPWRVAFALQGAGWWLRSDVIWSKPNPMPESVTDRPTKSHEYVFMLTKSSKYFYDADAIREPHNGAPRKSGPNALRGQVEIRPRGNGQSIDEQSYHPAGRNRRTVWEVATAPYAEAHFATFPPKLIEPMVKAGTSERGCCPECGAPWVRVVERAATGRRNTSAGSSGHQVHRPGVSHDLYAIPSQTVGWQPSCTCDAGDPIPCVVLDPFMGSGTTALVAQRLGRRAIGIDLNTEYLDLAIKRTAQKALWFANGDAA